MAIRRAAGEEALVIRKGLLILIAVIIMGVTLADSQLNGLTQRNSCVQFLNFKRVGSDGYAVYLMGNVYRLRAAYAVAFIEMTDEGVTIRSDLANVSLPIYAEANYNRIAAFADLWFKQFKEEAIKLKKFLYASAVEVKQTLYSYISQFR